MTEDEDLLLAVLNSAPVAEGVRQDLLAGESGAQLVRSFGGTGSDAERTSIMQVREHLQDAICGHAGALDKLSVLANDMSLKPTVTPTGLHWELTAPADLRLAARVLVAWSEVQHERPGRLRACANTECNLYLLDRSRPGTAKWCSMATCGNRMKVRAHAERVRTSR